MKKIEINKKEIDFGNFKQRTAFEKDFNQLIRDDVLIVENGEPKILYIKLQCETENLRKAVKNIKYSTTFRTKGLKTTSRIFGYNPRNTIRKDYCSATSLSFDSPIENKIICDFGSNLSKLYEQYFPMVFAKHNNGVEENIKSDWIIKGTPFTSGIVNKNNPLKYHFDAGNIKEALSNMVVFKKFVAGGYLACPEYDIGFEVADNTAILFDGQKILHGVTPIKRLTENAYRYSVVYYTLQQMWQCLVLNEEILRARKTHFIREKKRIEGKSFSSGTE